MLAYGFKFIEMFELEFSDIFDFLCVMKIECFFALYLNFSLL